MGLGFRWIDGGVADPGVQIRREQEWLERAEPTAAVWESDRECVVLGVSGREERDVRREASPQVFRRTSGGGAVVLGPGCLAYCVIVPFEYEPECRDVRHGFTWILERMLQALRVSDLRREGAADLSIGTRKVSGNAQRRGRRGLLHHGTLLYRFDAERAEALLAAPHREPAYRAGRSHREFLGNLPLSSEEIRARFGAFWS